ncbi:TetR family transcriptional regulator [Chthonobacter rhizosphaerae]|uniref:TetR family transcriptional regulator n=1 Tax=Chthonobacter rhizosphaerae TaxID=2735553 RepID=UPI0015EF1D28
MARTSGSNGERTAAHIRDAGVRLIHRHGFEAMSLRQLATEVGLQPGSLYNHFENKQALLFEIVRTHMEELLAELGAALEGRTDPVDRLTAFSAFHLRYHMTRRMLVYIANSELRSLEPGNREAIVALRGRYEATVVAILADGVASGAFKVADVRVAAYAVIAMLTGVCDWYRPDGRLGQEEIARLYTDLVLKGVTG